MYKCECLPSYADASPVGAIPGSVCNLDYCSDVNFCPTNTTCKNLEQQVGERERERERERKEERETNRERNREKEREKLKEKSHKQNPAQYVSTSAQEPV